MKIKVLDHGFVRLVESWGHGDLDASLGADADMEVGIIEAARQSTQGSFRGWEQDEKLLRYLHQNKHATPFEFAGMVIEVRAPIFVFREWHRHRTQSYNEMSARYAPLPAFDYMPDANRLVAGSWKTPNKQAGSVGEIQLSDDDTMEFLRRQEELYEHFESHYQWSLRVGVPKELARIGMPVGRYSQMRASTCLRNWLSFLTLRMAPQAQYEIRQYANAVGQIIADQFPRTWRLFRSEDGNAAHSAAD